MILMTWDRRLIKCVIEVLYITSVSMALDLISFVTQPRVLHLAEFLVLLMALNASFFEVDCGSLR